MNFLLDHDVPGPVGDVLRQEGHSIQTVREVMPVNSTDSEVLTYAAEHELLLITCNRNDFLKLAASFAHHGIIILIRRHSRLDESAALLRLLRSAGENGLIKNINFA